MQRSPDPVSQVRLADATSECDYQSQVVTDGRTDGRTSDTNNDSDILQLSDARARVEADDVLGLGQVIADGFLPTGNRFPVIRTGSREPIPYHVWHWRDPVEEALTVAYCAHCCVPTMTDVTL